MKRLVVWLVLLLMAAGCGPQGAQVKVGDITIENPWARSAQSGGTTAAFMLLKNSGSEVDRLVKAEYAGAEATEIHLSKMVDDVMQMAPVDSVEIPAGGQTALKPGSYHVMMIQLKQELKEGDRISLVLTFERAGSVTVDMPVKNP